MRAFVESSYHRCGTKFVEAFTTTAEEEKLDTLWVQSISAMSFDEKERLELDRISWNTWWTKPLVNSKDYVPIRNTSPNLPMPNIWQEATIRLTNEMAIAKSAAARWALLTPEEKCFESYYQFLDESKLERCCSNWQDCCRLEHSLNRCETDLAIAQRRNAVEREIDDLYKSSEQLFQDQQP